MIDHMSLLIVDDREDNLLILRSLVKEHFPFVEIFETTSAAVGIQLAADKQVDGALIDVQMPNIDGIEMCSRLKADARTHSTSVILLTSHRTTSELRAKGLEAGADDFIHRPLDNVEFVARVKVMLRAKRAENELRKMNERLDALVTDKVNKLRESEMQLRTVFDAADNVAFVTTDLDGKDTRVLSFSPGAEKIFGYTSEEIIGRKVSLLHSPNAAESFPSMQQALREGNKCHSGETMLVRKSGEHFPALFTLHPMHDDSGALIGTLGVSIDIIERKRAEESLQQALADAEEARDKVQAILESVADGLIFTDMNDRIVLMSASAEALLDKKLSESFLQPLEAAIVDKNLREHISAIKANGENEATLELDLPGGYQGQGRIIQAKSSLVRRKGGIKSGVITLLRDVSREKELDRMKSEFISTAAHELRTPLTSVKGYSQLLLTDKDLGVEQQTQFLSIIDEKANVLDKIIDDLLDLSRVESGRVIHVEKHWYDLGPVLADLVGQYQTGYKTHHFKAVLPENPLELLVDKGKIVQVMENLLSNAVKFSPEGSLIQITCEMFAREVQISVKDVGIGMTAQQVERIFDKFYRVDASNTAKEGLGLGMSIVKNIVETHGGHIWVESEPDRGTRVNFILPIGQESETLQATA